MKTTSRISTNIRSGSISSSSQIKPVSTLSTTSTKKLPPPSPLDVAQEVMQERALRRQVKAQKARQEAIQQLNAKRAKSTVLEVPLLTTSSRKLIVNELDLKDENRSWNAIRQREFDCNNNLMDSENIGVADIAVAVDMEASHHHLEKNLTSSTMSLPTLIVDDEETHDDKIIDSLSPVIDNTLEKSNVQVSDNDTLRDRLELLISSVRDQDVTDTLPTMTDITSISDVIVPQNIVEFVPISVAPIREPDVIQSTLQPLNTSTPSPSTITRQDTDDTTEQRIDRILEYLRSVDKNPTTDTNISTTPSINNISTPFSLPSSSSAAVFDSVKAKMIGQQLELQEKTQTLILFKTELKKIRELNKEQSIQFKKELKVKLTLQRKEYETMIKRHLTFIDKLLAEKDEITKTCETMADKVKQLEKQYKDKISTMDEVHQRELKQQRALWESAEKIKRDKWMQERSKIIKEQTIKGLEPEIQRMIAQHKSQVAALESKQREDLRAERDSLMEQHERQMESFRDKLVTERQKACEEEREFARQRYQKQLEREEIEFQQQKRKMMADFQEQKDVLAATAREEKRQDDINHRKAMDELRAEIETEKELRAQALDEMRRRHVHETSQLRDKLTIEKEEWQNQYTARVDADIRQKERVFKETLLRERDSEIESIISRLESESSMSHSDINKRHRSEIEKLRATHADEVKQLKQQCDVALDKVIALHRKMENEENGKRDVEKDVWRLQNEVDGKQRSIDEMKIELRRLQEGENALKEDIHKSFSEQLGHKDIIIQSLQNQLAKHLQDLDGLRSHYNQEMEIIQKDKVNALHMIENKVRHTVSGKDDTIAALKTQMEELHIKNVHLELLIDKQRKELLS